VCCVVWDGDGDGDGGWRRGDEGWRRKVCGIE
jgi:hypothetical protein